MCCNSQDLTTHKDNRFLKTLGHLEITFVVVCAKDASSHLPLSVINHTPMGGLAKISQMNANIVIDTLHDSLHRLFTLVDMELSVELLS